MDAVSAGNVVTHGKAIAAGMRALALLGVDGVDLPISWGVFSNSGGDWSSYLAVAAMARDAGLRLRVSLHLHAHGRPQFPLPQLVERAVAADPDILFTDRSGGRHRECLSFAVDELPVLDGKTPLEAFEEFFQSFRVAFTDLMSSAITVTKKLPLFFLFHLIKNTHKSRIFVLRTSPSVSGPTASSAILLSRLPAASLPPVWANSNATINT